MDDYDVAIVSVLIRADQVKNLPEGPDGSFYTTQFFPSKALRDQQHMTEIMRGAALAFGRAVSEGRWKGSN